MPKGHGPETEDDWPKEKSARIASAEADDVAVQERRQQPADED